MISQRTVTVLSLSIISLSLILAFQNCGHNSRHTSLKALASNADGAYMPKEVIVQMKSDVDNQAFITWAEAHGLELMDHWDNDMMTHWRWNADTTTPEIQDLIASQDFADHVEFTEPNYMTAKTPDPTGVDAFSQTGVNVSSLPTTSQVLTTVTNVSFTQVTGTIDANKPPVILAIIDSGVDLNHPAFARALWTNPKGAADGLHGYDFRNNDPDPTDDDGHGTHCAGIALGVGRDIFNPPASDSHVQIMALKFIGSDGSGTTSAAINAIHYAVDHGAKVLSNSWGGGTPSRALELAISYAYDHNVAFIAAAGNDGQNNDSIPVYPASYTVPQLISVAAAKNDDTLASFSNFGPVSVSLAAPGVSILSTYPTSSYAYLSGTSMATPFVAGTVALMAYEQPTLNGYELKNLILNNSNYVEILSWVNGRRRLNSVSAITAAKAAVPSNRQPAYSPKGPSEDSSAGSSGGCGLVLPVNGQREPPLPPGAAGLLIGLFSLPLAVALGQRRRWNMTT